MRLSHIKKPVHDAYGKPLRGLRKEIALRAKADLINGPEPKIKDEMVGVARKIKEDWGSSDWYPIMKAMKAADEAGTSLEDAALDQAYMYHDMMGYDELEDTVQSIIRMYKRRKEMGFIKEDTLLEGYDERVAAAVKHLADKFKEQNVTRQDVLTALHKYAVADPSSDAAEHNRHVLWMNKPGVVYANGVPDYNGGAKARSEFIRDVLAGLKTKLRFGRAKMSAEEKAEKLAERKAAIRKRLDRIHSIVTDKIGQSFPDGDPIGRLIPWMDKNKVSMEEIDKAFRVNGDGSYNDYLIDMWDQMASDATYDAEHGHIDPNSPYYDTDKEGKVKKRDNPWGKKTSKPKKAAKRPDDDEPFDLAAWKASGKRADEQFSFEEWKARSLNEAATK